MSTVSSQAPKVGIALPEEPQATSSMVGSIHFMVLAVSTASRPYSSAVLAPICQGPSISLPRHHSLTPYGAGEPFLARRLANLVPTGLLQYSTQLRASSGV